MKRSDRLSARVVEHSANHLFREQKAVAKRADGGSPARAHHRRVGPRQLASLKALLTDRDIAVMRSLESLHYLTTQHIERLHFRNDMTPLAAARGARRVLARLHDQGLLVRLQRRVGGIRAGSASYVIKLSSTGSRLLDSTNRRRSREPSLNHLDHVLAVAEVAVRLHEQARSADGRNIQVVGVEGEPVCWRSFVAAHGGRGLLKPDLRLTIGVGEQDFHWFCEIDRGSEHKPVLTKKLNTYLAAWRDGGEQARAGVYPRVVWITPNDERTAVIESVIAMINAPTGMFVVTTMDKAIAVLTGGAR